MSFIRLNPDDIVISSDSITSTVWSGNSTELTTFHTSSTQEASSAGGFYLNVFQTASSATGSAIQFAIAYGNKTGSGSAFYNTAVTGSTPSATIFGQYQNLIIGDENTDFIFGAVTSSEFYALSIDRARYKEKILPGSLSLKLSGSLGSINLTDDSQYTTTLRFNEAGRIFNLISGSLGVKYTNAGTTTDGHSVNSGSYGWFLPDIGTLILNPLALSGSLAAGGIGLIVSRSFNANAFNNRILFNAISGSSAKSFKLNSEETISSQYIFIRVKNGEFNYSENPSFISGSTGEVLYDDFINNPQTFITTVGLYNDTNELLATAKLSRPLVKDFTKECLLRLKLDY